VVAQVEVLQSVKLEALSSRFSPRILITAWRFAQPLNQGVFGPGRPRMCGTLIFFRVDLQRYVSPDLTHFVGAALPNQTRQFALLKKIIHTGVLQAMPRFRRLPMDVFQHAKYVERRLSSNEAYRGAVVCFCDIPVADLPFHMQKYSRFGIAFRKAFLVEQGVSPVMYLPHTGRPSLLHFYELKPNVPPPTHGISSLAVAFDRFWEYLNKFHKRIEEDTDDPGLAAEWRRVIGFLDLSVLSYLKFFDHCLHDEHKDNYYLEREWRASKSVEFELNDIQRIIVPTAYSRKLRLALPNYDGEILFAD
jgi:hypothetical protein